MLSPRVELADSPALRPFATFELLQEVARDHRGAEGVPLGADALLLVVVPLAHGGGGGRGGRMQGGEGRRCVQHRRGVGARLGRGLGPLGRGLGRVRGGSRE